MMTLDEAIKHCEEVAEERQKKADMFKSLKDFDNPKSTIKHGYEDCLECAKEHRQLAEWLRELKKYRFIFEKVGKILADNGYTMDDLDTIFGKANDEEVNADGDSN